MFLATELLVIVGALEQQVEESLEEAIEEEELARNLPPEEPDIVAKPEEDPLEMVSEALTWRIPESS